MKYKDQLPIIFVAQGQAIKIIIREMKGCIYPK